MWGMHAGASLPYFLASHFSVAGGKPGGAEVRSVRECVRMCLLVSEEAMGKRQREPEQATPRALPSNS